MAIDETRGDEITWGGWWGLRTVVCRPSSDDKITSVRVFAAATQTAEKVRQSPVRQSTIPCETEYNPCETEYNPLWDRVQSPVRQSTIPCETEYNPLRDRVQSAVRQSTIPCETEYNPLWDRVQSPLDDVESLRYRLIDCELSSEPGRVSGVLTTKKPTAAP